jgi:hypothetical protein
MLYSNIKRPRIVTQLLAKTLGLTMYKTKVNMTPSTMPNNSLIRIAITGVEEKSIADSKLAPNKLIKMGAALFFSTR